MSDRKCPFCGEPRLRNSGGEDLFTCGTRGPDINGEYDTGHTCDIHTWSRVLAEKEAEIERLQRELDVAIRAHREEVEEFNAGYECAENGGE